MELMETISQARDAITVRRVYGEPCEHEGVTVIRAAAEQGGVGLVAFLVLRSNRAPGAVMGIDVTTEIEIDRPRAEVAAYASDPSNAGEWYTNIESVEWQTPKPLNVGSRIAFVARFLGRRLAYVYEVKEIVPEERFVMATADGPLAMETTYAWADAPGGGTRMKLRNRGQPSGFSRLAAPLLPAAVRRANRKDLAALKRILEAPLSPP